MAGYHEYYTIVYRDDQRVMILNENPAERKPKLKAPPKRGISKGGLSSGKTFGDPSDKSRLAYRRFNSNSKFTI
jgi:hypothetical protein